MARMAAKQNKSLSKFQLDGPPCLGPKNTEQWKKEYGIDNNVMRLSWRPRLEKLGKIEWRSGNSNHCMLSQATVARVLDEA